jgi:hypothetical protein
LQQKKSVSNQNIKAQSSKTLTTHHVIAREDKREKGRGWGLRTSDLVILFVNGVAALV